MTTIDLTQQASLFPVARTRQERRRAPQRSGGGRGGTAWLLVILLIAVAVGGGFLVARERIAAKDRLTLTEVTLLAEPLALGSPDAAFVRKVAVTPGDSVTAGQPLVALTLTSTGDAATSRAIVRAPRAARVVSVDGVPGTIVRAGNPVVTLYDPADMTFRANVGREDVARLRVGMTAQVQGLAGKPVRATVGRLNPTLGPATAAFEVTLKPTDPTTVSGLAPGLPFTATVDLSSAPKGAGSVLGVER